MYSPVHTVGGSSLPSGWERILGQGHFHPPTCAGATIRAQKVDKSKTIHFDKMCTGHSGTSLPMGHPGQAGTVLTNRRQNILTMKVQAKRHEPPPGASGSGRFHAGGVEKHQNRDISKQIQQHRRLRPCCSHPIPSHPIPSRPIPRVRHTRRTRTANTRSEHTQREDETRRQTPRAHGRDGHVPSAKACQVPRRAKCQGARPTDAQGQQDKHGENAQRAHTTRRRDTQADSTGVPSRRSRARCQGVPSAKASQVPRRPTDQPRRDANTQASATDPLALHGRTRTLTTARTQVPSAKACQVPGRAKCQGVVQESAKARVRACKGRLGMGWVWAADAGGRERR